MSYVPVNLGLSADKLRSLGNGRGVRLHASHIGKGVPVHMTRRQADKAMRHHRAGKGMILRLSPAQVRHHQRGGADWTTARPRGGGGIMGKGVISARVPRPRKNIAAAPRAATGGQQKNSADHPIVTSFERDPLPGEHYAIPQ